MFKSSPTEPEGNVVTMCINKHKLLELCHYYPKTEKVLRKRAAERRYQLQLAKEKFERNKRDRFSRKASIHAQSELEQDSITFLLSGEEAKEEEAKGSLFGGFSEEDVEARMYEFKDEELTQRTGRDPTEKAKDEMEENLTRLCGKVDKIADAL